jgi:hypothetical protein
MESKSTIQSLITQIEEYKNKYFLNKVLKGTIISASILLATYLLFNTLEYFGRFGTSVRAVLFFSFLFLFILTIFTQILKPGISLLSKKKPIDNENAAKQIGDFFPEIKDKLLNTLQLSASQSQNQLIQASIAQKTKQLGVVRFTDAIKIEENKKYAKFVVLPAIIIAAILLIYPAYFAESSKRILYFKNEFSEPAPFQFIVKNKNFKAFKNEDFSVELALVGKALPKDLYLVINDRKINLESIDNKSFSYTFRNVQKPITFSFEASGFKSNSNTIEVINRPSLNDMKVHLAYPSYLNKQNITIENSGNLIIPEGTNVAWEVIASDVDSINFLFNNETKKPFLAKKSLLSNQFNLTRQIRKSTEYNIKLYNEFSANKDGALYSISVIPDNFPTIALEQYKDTTLFNYIVLGGKIADDYGFKGLKVHYTVTRDQAKTGRSGSFNIPYDNTQNIQSFYSSWMLDSLNLNPGDKLTYYAQVSDNDGVNGSKSTKTEILEYKVPTAEKIDKNIENALDKTQEQLDKTLSNAEKLKNELANLEKKLKNNPELN